MIETLNWIIVGLSLLGAYLNSNQDRRGLYCWTFTNIYWMAYNMFNWQWPQAVLFAAYLLLTVYGLFKWQKK